MDEYWRERHALEEDRGKLTQGDRLTLLEGYLNRESIRVKKRDQQRNRNSLLFGVFVLLMFAVAVAIITKHSTDNAQSAKIHRALTDNRRINCASANQTAVAYRAPLPNESEEHFVDRLIAQRFILNATRGINCEQFGSLAGFLDRRSEALKEIRKLIGPRGSPPVHPLSRGAEAQHTSGSVSSIQTQGGGTSTGSTPPSPPAPPQGGEPTGPQGPQGTTGPQGPPPQQPGQPGVLNPVTDPLGFDCQVTVLGVTVCN